MAGLHFDPDWLRHLLENLDADPAHLPEWVRVLVKHQPTETELLERDLYRWLRDELKTISPQADLQRIESGRTGLGIPDLNYCIDGVEGWIELKVATITKKAPYRVTFNLRPEQGFWLTRRAQVGGNTWLLIAVPGHGDLESKWGTLVMVKGLFGTTLVGNGSRPLDELVGYGTEIPRARGPQLRRLIDVLTLKGNA